MSMRRTLVQALVLLLGGVIVLAALIVLGQWARDWLRQQDRYAVAFADIDCPPPPGMERAAFLGEVQYLGSLPDRVQVLDDGLAARLNEAFARHPWVRKVERVEVAPAGQVRVHLAYRTPVLVVPLAGQVRAVDADGILLPASASTEGLPVFPGTAAPPQGPAGTPWGDAAVEAAARAAVQP
jgi:hypothetical protein